MRDDFSARTKEILAKRVAYKCSNPSCAKTTSGPQENPTRTINIGVAAHIEAASSDGPRYNPSQTSEQRSSIENGIWLCQSCAKLIDSDESRYSVNLLLHWKTVSESAALRAVERGGADDNEPMFLRIEQQMPELLDRLRKELKESPLTRAFVVGTLSSWQALVADHEVFYDDYESLKTVANQLNILNNIGLIFIRTTYEDEQCGAMRFMLAESFARYLGA